MTKPSPTYRIAFEKAGAATLYATGRAGPEYVSKDPLDGICFNNERSARIAGESMAKSYPPLNGYRVAVFTLDLETVESDGGHCD